MTAHHTDDGRYVVVEGRRWRASDPSIPDPLRSELVAELMSARRAVATAGRSEDDDALARARARVDDAKRALGERGDPWWEQPSAASTRRRVEATIRALARHRSPRTICPSDAARVVGGDAWRGSMEAVREVAASLQETGEIRVLQRGEDVRIRDARGPIRLRLDEPPDP